MSDSESEDDHRPLFLPPMFPFPFMGMMGHMVMHGGRDSDDDDDDDDSGSDEFQTHGPHRVIMAKQVVFGDYRLYLNLLECRYYDHGFLLTCELKQKLHESARFTGIEAVDRIIHGYIPETEIIGRLKAPVVLRPHDEFHDVTDFYDLNDEANAFCNRYGVANQCRNPLLRNSADAVQNGSVVFLDTLEIHPDHCGKDLGLRMVHEALEFLDYVATIREGADILTQYPRFRPNENIQWNLAVASPKPMDITSCEFWTRKTQQAKGFKNSQNAKWALNVTSKLCRYFARFGFAQAGQNVDECHCWFLTKEMRAAITDGEQQTPSPTATKATTKTSKKRKRTTVEVEETQKVPPNLWLDKVQTASLGFYTHPPAEGAHRGNRKALLMALNEFFVSKQQAEEALVDGIHRFDHLMERPIVRPVSGAEKYKTLANIQTSIQEVLGKGRTELRERVLEELLALRERFLLNEIPALLKKCKKASAASVINDTYAIHKVLSHVLSYPDIQDSKEATPKEENHSIDDFVSCLELLTKFGGDVNLTDPQYGNTPLHLAQGLVNKVAYRPIVQFLLRAGADPTIQNGKFETPTDLLVQHYSDRLPVCRFPNISKTEKLIARMLESSKMLMPVSVQELLTDDCLSPRMAQMLEKTAARVYSRGSEVISKVRGNWRIPQIDVMEGNGYIEYIPQSVLDRNDRGGLCKTFLRGWYIIFQAFSHLVENEQEAPTVDNIRKHINCKLLPGGRGQKAAFNAYLRNGGKVEFALDAIIGVTEKECYDSGRKSGLWAHSATPKEIEEYPATPLDSVFEVPRFMLVAHGGSWEPYGMGPFRNNI